MKPLPTPPEIPGLTVVRHLGGGGFADVYLYEQKALGRNVAVKVLRANASTEDVQRQFTAESRLMAALSDHINIVTIHDAAIAADGRPYLLMAYCPGLNLADRYKTQQIAVGEVLSIGVQLAGAVETAHRQGILHRDIKPANVLTAAGGRPALTDFGISVAMGAMHEEESVGLSIPWSPPEMLSGTPTGDHRADVYSLAATLFTLLARRSPYELPGRSNDQVDLITRIQRMALTQTGRADVPQSVEVVLATGLAKEPGRRYQSALELARALQRLEAEMGGAITPVDISAEDPVAARAEIAPENDGRTRIRPLVIEAQHPTTSPDAALRVDRTQMRGATAPTVSPPFAAGSPSRDAASAAESTQLRGAAARPDYLQPSYLQPQVPPDTQARQAPPVPLPPVPVVRKSRVPLFVGAGVGLVLIAGVGAVLAVKGTAAAPPPSVNRSVPTVGAFVSTAITPAPTDLLGKVVGKSVIFTWKNPAPLAGDYYEWQKAGAPATAQWERLTSATVTIPGTSAVCIDVNLIRQDGSSSVAPASACAGKG